jgi:3-carboxymethyl-3-hydroxy-acyl-[acp] dehydratase
VSRSLDAPDALVTRHAGHLRVEFAANPATLSSDVLMTIADTLDKAEGDRDCRAVVISARGPQFCLGMPLDSATSDGWGDGSEILCWQLFQRLTTTPVVTISVVEGNAAGGGVALAAACDFVIAGPAGRFRLPEVLLGLVPAMALPVIARRTGSQAATRLALSAREIGPVAAVEIGLIDEHGPEPEILLRDILRTLNGTDRDAAGLVKTARNISFPLTNELGEQACAVLRKRLRDPSVLTRLGMFRDEGFLP